MPFNLHLRKRPFMVLSRLIHYRINPKIVLQGQFSRVQIDFLLGPKEIINSLGRMKKRGGHVDIFFHTAL